MQCARSDNPCVLKLPVNLPTEKLRTLNAIAEALQNVSNVVAVVLGGIRSWLSATPLRHRHRDFYRGASPFSVDQVRSVAESICMVGSVPTVTGMYDWGTMGERRRLDPDSRGQSRFSL
jgi:hypothetical protein